MTTANQLEVRIARESDAAAIAAIYAPIVTRTAISFETTAPSAGEMAERLRSTLRTHPFLVADRSGEVAGYAYAGAHRTRAAYQWSTDVTVYVAPHAQRRGVARRLYGALLASLEAQGFHVAFAGIALPNDPSVALHEAVGFEPLGVYHEVGFKLGRWHDVGWWRRGLSASRPPAPPTPFAELAPGWRPP